MDEVTKAEPVKVEPERTLISWKAKSRPFKPVEQQTRSVMVVLAILVTLVLVVSGEWMLLIVLAAGVFYYYVSNRIPPEVVDFSITNKGLRAFGRLYMWWEMKRWWIDEKLTTKLLSVELSSGLVGRMYVPLEDVSEEGVKKTMEKYLEYGKPEPTAADKMSKWVGEKFPLENKI